MRRRRAMGMGVDVVMMRVVVGMSVRHGKMLHYNITEPEHKERRNNDAARHR